jgi:hypothetical protein
MPKPIRGYVPQRFTLELDKVSYAQTKQKVEEEVGVGGLSSAKILNYIMKKYLGENNDNKKDNNTIR